MRYILSAIAVLSLGLSLNTSADKTNTLVFAADEWCPYNCNPSASQPGFVVEILQAIYEPLGYSVQYEIIPWARALQLAESAQINGVIGAIPAEAPNLLFPKESAGKVQHTFYSTQASEWSYTGIESLKGLRLGAIRNYSYGDTMDRYIAQHKNEAVILLGGERPLDNLTRMLKAGRIDTIIEDQAVFQNYLISSHQTSFFRKAGSAASDAIYVAFGQAAPSNLSDEYDKGIKLLRANGQLKLILARYGLEDWQ